MELHRHIQSQVDPFSAVACPPKMFLNKTYGCDDIGILCMTGIYCINWCHEWTHMMWRQRFSLTGLIRDFLPPVIEGDGAMWFIMCLSPNMPTPTTMIYGVVGNHSMYQFYHMIIWLRTVSVKFQLKGVTTTCVPYEFQNNNAMLRNSGSTSMVPQT